MRKRIPKLNAAPHYPVVTNKHRETIMDVRNSKPVEQIVAAIEALDLDPIKLKLMDHEEGQGWSREYTEKMAIAYKRFLTLLVTHPETPIAPSKDIDKFWHGHILDTMKYAEDCESIFGYFLHHFPYFGMRGEDDATALADAGQAMEQLYQREFGEQMPQGQTKAAYCTAAKPAYCTASIKAAYCTASKPAYCTAAVKAAYCTASKPAYCTALTRAAYCTASRPINDAAYCTAATRAAYCTAAVGTKPLDLKTRPSLAKAA